MKSALIVSDSENFFATSREFLLDRYNATYADDSGYQVQDPSGRLFTMYNDDYSDVGGWDGSFNEPSPSTPEFGFVVECRWEDFFVEVVKALQQTFGGRLEVIDSAGQRWQAESIDCESLRL
jgi:hypothetical protein